MDVRPMCANIAGSNSCIWCGARSLSLSKDHVFPRVLGGTREVWVWACGKCQNTISRIEQEVGRRSLYSLYVLTQGPRGRDKRKPQSGAIQARYFLVKNPLGGYGEAAFRVGEELPETLPHIEIDVRGRTEIRRRGMKPQDVERLVRTLLDIVTRAPNVDGFLGEVTVLTDSLPGIDSDQDFWPRIVLGLSGKPFIRARDASEALRFTGALLENLNTIAICGYDKWTKAEIVAGTPHDVLLSYDPRSVQRVVAKIAYGLAYLRCGGTTTAEELYPQIRQFVRGIMSDTDQTPVKELGRPGSMTIWPDHHVAFVGSWGQRVTGLVSMYGDCHLVDFGPSANAPATFGSTAATCRRDGTETRMVHASIERDINEALTNEAVRAGFGPGG